MTCKCNESAHPHKNPCNKKVTYTSSMQWDNRESNRCCVECYDLIVEQTKKEVLSKFKNFGK